MKFSLKLRHQDKEVLDELIQFFGCGQVYIQRDKRQNHSLCYRYEVQNKKELLERIIPFFVQNPPRLPSRMRDFELFTQIMAESKRFKPDFGRVEELKSKMHWGLAVYGKSVRAVGTRSSE